MLVSSDSNFIISPFLNTPRCLFMLFCSFLCHELFFLLLFHSCSCWTKDDDKTGFHTACLCLTKVENVENSFNASISTIIQWFAERSIHDNSKLSSGGIHHESDVYTATQTTFFLLLWEHFATSLTHISPRTQQLPPPEKNKFSQSIISQAKENKRKMTAKIMRKINSFFAFRLLTEHRRGEEGSAEQVTKEITHAIGRIKGARRKRIFAQSINYTRRST